MKNIFFYKTDIGRIGIAEEDNQITNVFFNTDICLNQNTKSEECTELKEYTVFLKNCYINETDILREASSQLFEYLLGKRQVFRLPLSPIGTTFMNKVWSELCDIPYGKTKSYKEIAEAVGNIKACRAVGLANNRNPIPIFIPCHRVIGANGKLIGYRGGLEAKLHLLELEKQYGII
jgi:methylated-DNA-[protein]-cysteine S-methyltransferase